MHPVRALFLIALITLITGCDAEVVLGRYLPLSADDGGASDGGELDAGLQLDAGADAGLDPDAGTDAGTDAGPDPDAGADAGLDLDAGSDAGPIANLALRFVGEFMTDVDAGAFPLQFQVQNTGDAGASGLTLTLTSPPEVQFLTFPGCSFDAGTALCTTPSLGPSSVTTFSATVRFPTTPRWIDLRASISSTTPEARLDDNAITQPLALAPAGVQVLPVPAPRVMDLTFCVGSNLLLFAQCVPGSRAYDAVVLSPDGRMGLLRDGGAILSDGGIQNVDLTDGYWVQPADQRQFGFRLLKADGGPGAGYIGGSVSATCFEGTATTGSQVHNGVAWQGCLR